MNIVQFVYQGVVWMNTVVTSREQILDAAKKIAALEGATQISIRGVAKACGVSVGSIYNLSLIHIYSR